MATTPLVIDLRDLRAAEPPLVGGKAANLHSLIAAGFAVPDGFCVTTAAYPTATAGADPERARTVLLTVPLPDDLTTAVVVAYTALGPEVPVAVRSSATAEDLPTASFAGQQDTFLSVVGAEAVLDAMRRCWASLWTDRAVSYRATAGIDDRGVLLAVVVQRMVDVDVAGVLFTADPVIGRRTRTVIDASPGLGEAVVSGLVNPDHVVVEGDGRIGEHRIGDKTVVVRPRAGGGTEQVPGTAAPGTPCLSDAQIRELVALGRRVEAHFGAPQDIEWAIDTAGAVRLTQSRPITTLYPQPDVRGDGLRVYFCVSLAQGLIRPITPMGISAFRVLTSTVARLGFGLAVADPVAGPPAFVTAGGRVFADITPVLRSAVGRAVVPHLLDAMETRSAVVVRSLFDDPALAVRSRSRWPFVGRALAVLLRYRVPLLVALSLARPAAARRRVGRVSEQLLGHTRMPHGTGGAERLDHVEEVLAQVFPVMPRVFPVAVSGLAMLGLARKLAGADLDDATADEVLRSLPHNCTTVMNLELWALAQRLRADPVAAQALLSGAPEPLPPSLRAELDTFLGAYGHRAVAEIDLGMPRWSDDPSHVLGVLANYLRHDDPARAPDVLFARGARAADAAVAAVVTRVRRRSPARARVVAFALRRVRQLAGMREEHKDLLVRMLAHTRTELAQVGAELAGRGLLDAAADVFFLDLAQARSAVGGHDHRPTVTAHRAEYDRELRRRHVPRILLSDGTEPEALAPAGPVEGALVGTPASAGTATAAARVVLDPVGAHLEPGEILVAPSTDPGWTPLFLTAGGLVMEMGGPNSHGAVVAREYGIPAVVGVAGATVRLSTGETVTVDGAAGTVRPTAP